MKQTKLNFDLSFLDQNDVANFGQLKKEDKTSLSKTSVDNSGSASAGALRFLYKIFINILVYGVAIVVLTMVKGCIG